MSKSDFQEFADKIKSSADETAKKVKQGLHDASDKVKEKADDIVKAAQKKTVKEGETTDPAEKDQSHEKEEDPKKKLDDILQSALEEYNHEHMMMSDKGTTLLIERIRSVDLIEYIENLVNSIANKPKSFETEIAEIKMHRESFNDTYEFAKAEFDAALKSAIGAGAGITAGVAVASIAPTAALWVATTFGTASTGTAISTLSGAVATKAALAWLGGGALAAGGGGMAAGQALLALAGPIGWGIAGVTLLSSIVIFSTKKLKLDKEKKEKIEIVKNLTDTVRKNTTQIQELLDENNVLRDNLSQQYNSCLINYNGDFTAIPKEQQIQLGALVNNTKALAASLNRKVE
jgi:hypothetical protein